MASKKSKVTSWVAKDYKSMVDIVDRTKPQSTSIVVQSKRFS